MLEAIADPNTAIAVIGLLTKHLAITLVGRHGEERAKAMLQKIILDAPRSSTRLIHSPPKTALSVPTAAETGPSGDVDCGHCGLGFTSIDVYSRHRCDGACITPTDCGLVVAPRVKLTWSIPVRVPTAMDPFGNVTEWVECDREIAGAWDDRVWRDHP